MSLPSARRAVRRPQARGLATRARLLAAAEELFTRRGFDGTSIGDVAERAGVGVGTVYHHFPDKRAMLLELVEDWGDRMAAQRRSELELERFLSGDLRQAFHRWLERAHRRLRKQPSLYLVVLGLAARDPEVAERYRRIEQLLLGRWRELIEFGQRRGLMRASLDAASAAFLMNNAVEVAATQLLVRGVAEPDPERVVAELGDMMCRYLLEEER